MPDRAVIRDALAALDVRRLLLGIHDPSFPGAPAEDLGRGTPYSRASERFLDWISELGFDGVQLGPQGLTSEGSPSPYESTIFSRNPLNLAAERLVEQELLDPDVWEALVASRPDGALERMPYPHVYRTGQRLQLEVHGAVRRGPPELLTRVKAFAREQRPWLERDALYAALNDEHCAGWYGEWTSPQGQFDQRLFAPARGDEAAVAHRIEQLLRDRSELIERYVCSQMLVHAQHAEFRQRMKRLGLAVYGDMQIGLSSADTWGARSMFLPGYLMGAPPSRTNLEGQPWGYPLLDPAQYGSPEAPGPAIALVRARVAKMLAEYDGLRIDHPHGWVCPWVYRSDLEDPLRAVQQGARLFSSPNLPDHPALAQFAIARPEQLNLDVERCADGWVRELEPEQVDRYARLFDVIMETAEAGGLPHDAVVCEVLSTMPYPLRRVLERAGLGRFRVVQKARLDDPRDVYRSENAKPEDWMMMGNHDTPPIWRVVERWAERGEVPDRAAYLASKLEPRADAATRERLAQRFAGDPGLLVHAVLADALASPARNFFIFFADLFGMREVYNAPGTISSGELVAPGAVVLPERTCRARPIPARAAPSDRGGHGAESQGWSGERRAGGSAHPGVITGPRPALPPPARPVPYSRSSGMIPLTFPC